MASKKSSSSAKNPSTRGMTRGASKSSATKAVAVRNSAIPKSGSAARRSSAAPRPIELTWDMIARRAYEISQSPECGSEFDNWCRAERELRARQA